MLIGGSVAMMTLLFAGRGARIPGALLFFAVTTGMMHGLIGTLLGIWAAKWDQYTALHTFVLLPLAFLSRRVRAGRRMPETAADPDRLNPIFYLIDGFRYGMIGEAAADLLPLRRGGARDERRALRLGAPLVQDGLPAEELSAQFMPLVHPRRDHAHAARFMFPRPVLPGLAEPQRGMALEKGLLLGGEGRPLSKLMFGCRDHEIRPDER